VSGDGLIRRCAASLALLWLATLLPGCADEERRKITIDLSASPVCHVGGQPARPPTRGGGAEAELLQIDARPIDFYQRLPSESVLFGKLPPGASPDDVRVSVTSSERQEVLGFVPNSTGVWRADLGGFGDAVVRLRLENRSDGPLSWGRLRIAGIETRVAPLLPPPPGTGKQPYNVLVYVVDALRADHLSVYGYERPTSPHLEEFARASAVFLEAHSTGPHTGTSIPSLLTSVVPSEVMGRLLRSEDGVPHTVAELFFDAGFETAGFESNLLLRKYMGYGRGFETFKLFSRTVDGEIACITATELHEHVVHWLEKPRERPFFLFVQSMDVHHPYGPPAPFLGRFGSGHDEAPPELTYLPEDWSPSVGEFYQKMARRLKLQYYDDGIAYADHELGLLFAALTDLGLRDSTVIIITADHGESLGEGGRFLHGLSLNQEQVHVPLLVSVPWLREPLRVHSLVSLLDVAPTLLDLAGIPVPAQFKGRSLMRSHPQHEPRIAVGERTGPKGFQEWFLRQGEWKLIATRRGRSLFHIPSDRLETRDLSEQRPILTRYLTGLLWANSLAFREPGYQVPSSDRHLDEARLEELEEAGRALGYIE
jgi:arylsulfatase A-like enzyme